MSPLAEILCRTRLVVWTGLLGLLVPAAAPAQDDAPAVDIAVKDEGVAIGALVPLPDRPIGLDIDTDLRPLMNVELGFIKRVCHPTPEQKDKIAAAAEACLQELSVVLAVTPRGGAPGQQRVVAVTASGQRIHEDPIQRIEEEMAAALRPLVSAGQYAEYAQQVAARSRFRRQTTVELVVEMIGSRLWLTDDQRSRLEARLLEDWNQAESTPMQTYLSNPRYLPPVPDALVEPGLDPDQKAIWRALDKTRFPLYLSQIARLAWEEDFTK